MSIRILILLSISLALCSCSTTPPPPSTAVLAARTSMSSARSKIITAKSRTADIGRSLTKAQADLAAPVLDKAAVVEDVKEADADRLKLEQDLDAAKTAEENADAQVDILSDANKTLAAKAAAETKRADEEEAAAKRWRLIALGLGVVVVGAIAIKAGVASMFAFLIFAAAMTSCVRDRPYAQPVMIKALNGEVFIPPPGYWDNRP